MTVYRPWTYANLHKSFFHRALYFLAFMCTSALALLRVPKFDVIVGCSPPITVAVAAWVASVVRRATFIFEVRDLWPAFPIQMGVIRNPLLIRFSCFVERLLYRRARLVIVNSPGFLPHLRENDLPEEKVRLVPNGVDLNSFRPLEPDADIRRGPGRAARPIGRRVPTGRSGLSRRACVSRVGLGVGSNPAGL